MKNAAHSQPFRNLDEHWSVVYKDCLGSRKLDYIQGQPEHMHVGLAKVNKERGNESVYQTIQVELANPISIELASFITHNRDLHSKPGVKLIGEFDHQGERFKLRKHEFPKMDDAELSLFKQQKRSKHSLMKNILGRRSYV